MNLRERVRYEVKEWRKCHDYHANKKRHARPKGQRAAVRANGGGTVTLERTALPRKVTWILIGTAAVVMYILIFGGTL